MRYLLAILPLLIIFSSCVSTKKSIQEDSSSSSHLEYSIEDIQKIAERLFQRTDFSVSDSTRKTTHIIFRIYDTALDANGKHPLKAEAEMDINETNVRNEHSEDSLLETRQEEHELESNATVVDSVSNHIEKERTKEATVAESFFKRFGSAILIALVILSVSFAIKVYKRKG